MKQMSTTMKTTIKMALPAMIESFFICFAGFLDSIMVSSLGPEAVASVGLTTQPKFIGYAIFTALSVSLSALVARRLGEGERDKANALLSTGVLTAVILAAIIGFLMSFFASPIIKFCGSNADTHDGAVLYFKIIMGCMIFNCIQICINAIQRGVGNTKITMRTNLTSNTVNVIFNYLLIGGKFGFPALGIRGAAIATILGAAVSCTMSIISVCKKDCYVNFIYIIQNKIKPRLVSLVNIIKLGYSIFLEQLLIRAGFLATALMAADQGTSAMAAHQACLNVISLSFAIGDGLQHAAVALIGRSLGEKNPDMAKEYGKKCHKIGGIMSIVFAVVFLLFSRWIMWLFFPKDPDIIDIGVSIMYILTVAVLLQIRQCIYMGSLRGAGDTKYTAFISAFSITVTRTIVGYVCCYMLGMGIFGVWMGVLADQVTRFIMSGARYKKGKWVSIKI